MSEAIDKAEPDKKWQKAEGLNTHLATTPVNQDASEASGVLREKAIRSVYKENRSLPYTEKKR